MTGSKFLIVNADDFGQSAGVNRGVIQANEEGILTSASLMVRWRAAAEAARVARNRRTLSIGLHLDFGEWVCQDGSWIPRYQVVPLDEVTAVRAEVLNQIALFRQLMRRDPTHIDSHQHVHLREPVRSVVLEAAAGIRVPVRGCTPDVHYCGRFYGQSDHGSPYPEGISVDALTGIIADLPPGLTELSCHPGDGQDLNTMYLQERSEEVKVLCHPRVRSALVDLDVRLCSFAVQRAS